MDGWVQRRILHFHRVFYTQAKAFDDPHRRRGPGRAGVVRPRGGERARSSTRASWSRNGRFEVRGSTVGTFPPSSRKVVERPMRRIWSVQARNLSASAAAQDSSGDVAGRVLPGDQVERGIRKKKKKVFNHRRADPTRRARALGGACRTRSQATRM